MRQRETHLETLATRAGRDPLLWVLLLVIAAYCGWILSLPLFPMQDGPVHLYLAEVLGALLRPGPSVYKDFYAAPRLLTPYCVQYYVLILLTKLIPAVVAEKLFVALIVVAQCLGFRYLGKAIGPCGALAALFLVGTVLNWPLLMGFQSYALAVALACWALGLWTRAVQGASRWLYAGFVACCCVILLTHPLPYLLVLAVSGIDVAAIRLMPAREREGRWRWCAVAFAAACVPLLFLRSFTRTHRGAVSLVPANLIERLRYFAGLHGLSFFRAGTFTVRLYEAAMLLALALGLTAAVVAIRRAQRRWTPVHTWLIATVLLLLMLLAMPDGFGGSRAIVLRMEPLLWIGALAAGSGVTLPRPRITVLLACLAVVSSLLVLGLSAARLAPIARRIAPINAIPTSESGRRGLLLAAVDGQESERDPVLYAPYYWEGVSYFRRTHSVLLNTPWMDSTWLPVQPRAGLLTADFDPDALEFYWKLRGIMVHSPEVRARILARTDFVIFTDENHQATDGELNALLDDSGLRWSCARRDWYVLCEKQSAAAGGVR